MPTGVKDRFCNTYEYVYFFVKDSGKYFNYDYFSDIDTLRIKPDCPVKEDPTWPQTLSIDDYDNIWKQKVEEFNNSKKYRGKFKNEEINMGKSPGARASKGISYSLQRVNKLDKRSSLPINQFLLGFYKNSGLKTSDIDAHFGYKDTSSHWFRLDPGRSIPKPEDWFKLKLVLDIDDDKYDKIMTETHYVLQNVKNNPKGKNPGDFWTIPTEKCRESHYAVYPTELPRRIIKGFCPSDGVVLDPFAGSGTTGLVAKELKRRCILIDCNPEFGEIIKKRINQK